MNRLLICIILLLPCHSVLAEKLYRWVEPDGSITFSPKPPPAGVDYKAVNSAHNNAAKEDLPEFDQKRSILATSEHSLDAPQKVASSAEKSAEKSAEISADLNAEPSAEPETRQKLTYAPDTGIKTNQSIRTADSSASNQAQPSGNDSLVQINPTADSKKRRHCQDLSKRVMSLERRLRSPLKPVDMDNTVIAMARYQRSYDRHCIE